MRRQRVLDLVEVGVGDELVGDDFLPDQAADRHGILPWHADHPGERREDVAKRH